MKKTIYISYFCEDDLGEVQGVFDEKGKMLDCWCCNDANWRHEYMNGFMKNLGVTVKHELPAKFKASAIKQLKEEFGF